MASAEIDICEDQGSRWRVIVADFDEEPTEDEVVAFAAEQLALLVTGNYPHAEIAMVGREGPRVGVMIGLYGDAQDAD